MYKALSVPSWENSEDVFSFKKKAFNAEFLFLFKRNPWKELKDPFQHILKFVSAHERTLLPIQTCNSKWPLFFAVCDSLFPICVMQEPFVCYPIGETSTIWMFDTGQ